MSDMQSLHTDTWTLQEWADSLSSSVKQQYEEGAARGGEVAQNLSLWREDVGKSLSGACAYFTVWWPQMRLMQGSVP